MRKTVHLLAIFLGVSIPRLAPAAEAEHVVVIVWDGLRPDFVTEQYTPTLHALARRGTFFQKHHSSYITSTEVNGTALATGSYPGRSGIMANSQYRSDLNWLGSFGTESLEIIRRADLLSGGHYIAVPTLPEILQSAGFATITAGAKPVVLLHDRSASKTNTAQRGSVTLFRGRTLPRSAMATLVANPQIGPFPEADKTDSTKEKIVHWLRTGRDKAFTWLNGSPPNTPLPRRIDTWTTRALINGLWKDSVPKYSLLWLSEPDAAQHETAPGSPNAEVGLEKSDHNLGLVLDALKQKGILERTDIFVVSDHGFSTVESGPDLIKALKRAKFVAGKEFDNPEAGDVMVVNLGGSTFFYVFDHDQPTIQRLVEFLQGTDFAGVIFSATPVEGTFPLSQVRLDAGQYAPDVVVSMRWTNGRNDWGSRGLIISPGHHRGTGTHASLSPFDLHNTLVAAGPDFKTNFVSELPSGNLDIAPTILAILGVKPAVPMDGRVLSEAFVETQSSPTVAQRETLKSVRDLGFRQWQQTLSVSRVGNVVYFDEGNGESSLK